MKNEERKNNQLAARTRPTHEFLLTLFDKSGGYEEKQMNGFWLIKQYRKEKSLWEVAIYTEDAYRKKKNYLMRMRK